MPAELLLDLMVGSMMYNSPDLAFQPIDLAHLEHTQTRRQTAGIKMQ